MKILIIYYSRKDENYFNGKLINIEQGNTEIAAKKIANIISADLFKIEQLFPYSPSYNECVNQAQKDLRNKARPLIKNYLPSVDEYDEIYLGYPNYWGTMPMAVFTFLEHYNFSGKIIKPFCTHEGSGMGNSEKDLKEVLKNSLIKRGLPIKGSLVKTSDSIIEEWIKENK